MDTAEEPTELYILDYTVQNYYIGASTIFNMAGAEQSNSKSSVIHA